ncbi:MAG: DUF4234 domain-containing protein [Lachnospiraceae bacterium]|nr:DUF4234 domain-containing protein [Lachnospiraceae bacterium]
MNKIQERNIVLSVVLSVVTCGIYGLYWFVCLTNDVNTISEEQGASGVMAVLFTIITCGIYGLYWAYKCGEKIDIAKQKRGIPASNGGVLYLILFIFGGIIAYALIQNELNNLASGQ